MSTVLGVTSLFVVSVALRNQGIDRGVISHDECKSDAFPCSSLSAIDVSGPGIDEIPQCGISQKVNTWPDKLADVTIPNSKVTVQLPDEEKEKELYLFTHDKMKGGFGDQDKKMYIAEAEEDYQNGPVRGDFLSAPQMRADNTRRPYKLRELKLLTAVSYIHKYKELLEEVVDALKQDEQRVRRREGGAMCPMDYYTITKQLPGYQYWPNGGATTLSEAFAGFVHEKDDVLATWMESADTGVTLAALDKESTRLGNAVNIIKQHYKVLA
jgi:hypothetical protein